MTQTATVEQLLGDGRVLISVARQTACAHNCAECAGCGGHAGSLAVRAVDRIGGVSVGEKVLVRSDNRPILTTAALVYLLPAAAFTPRRLWCICCRRRLFWWATAWGSP